jgi:hypothetical protein
VVIVFFLVLTQDITSALLRLVTYSFYLRELEKGFCSLYETQLGRKHFGIQYENLYVFNWLWIGASGFDVDLSGYYLTR